MRKHGYGVALYPPPEVGGFTATEDKFEQNIDNATGNGSKCKSTKVNKTIVRWSDPLLDGAVGLLGETLYFNLVEFHLFTRLSVSVGGSRCVQGWECLAVL